MLSGAQLSLAATNARQNWLCRSCRMSAKLAPLRPSGPYSIANCPFLPEPSLSSMDIHFLRCTKGIVDSNSEPLIPGRSLKSGLKSFARPLLVKLRKFALSTQTWFSAGMDALLAFRIFFSLAAPILCPAMSLACGMKLKGAALYHANALQSADKL